MMKDATADGDRDVLEAMAKALQSVALCVYIYICYIYVCILTCS